MTLQSHVWYEVSEHPLKAEDIQGRYVFSIGQTGVAVTQFNGGEYDTAFLRSINDGIRYMLIDRKEELMEYERKLPEIMHNGKYFAVYYTGWNIYLELTGFIDEPAARRAWNEWVKKVTA